MFAQFIYTEDLKEKNKYLQDPLSKKKHCSRETEYFKYVFFVLFCIALLNICQCVK